MVAVQERVLSIYDSMQSQIQSLMSAFSNMKEQPQVAVDSMAKTLYSSGLLIKAVADNNDDVEEQEQLIKAAAKAACRIEEKAESFATLARNKKPYSIATVP